MWELVFLQTLIRATQSFLGIFVMSQLLMCMAHEIFVASLSSVFPSLKFKNDRTETPVGLFAPCTFGTWGNNPLEQVREKTRLSEHQMETLCFSHNNSTHLRCFLWPPPETVEPFLSLSLKIRICFWLRAILSLSTSKNVWRNSHRPTDVPSSKAPHLHSCPDRAKRSFCAPINAVELQVLTGVGGVKWLKRWSL